jgi:hypothetical protein
VYADAETTVILLTGGTKEVGEITGSQPTCHERRITRSRLILITALERVLDAGADDNAI